MSLALLLEKYDVSTDEGLQKALSELENEEAEVNEALGNALSKACTLEGKLRNASNAYTQLGEVRQDAQVAADMVERTAALARDVSAKVRKLDLARTRVAECQRRVHDLIDLQLCSEGVEAAIKAHDYETAASHVSRFLAMEPASLAAARARSPPPRDPASPASPAPADPREALTKAADTLWKLLQTKFEEASRKEDDVGVERIYKLLPQIGRTDEGIQLLAKYHAKKLEAEVARASVVEGAAGGGAVWADAATRVLAAGAAAARCLPAAPATPSAAPAPPAAAAPAAAPAPTARAALAQQLLQPPVCAGVRRVFSSWVESNKRGAGGAEGAARGAAELALILSRVHMYFTFLRRRAEAEASTLPEADKQKTIDAMERVIASCDLTRTSQDVLAEYLSLEKINLEENVGKALKMSQQGDTESSLVDDVFFITKRVISRAISTGSVEAVCVMVNISAATLEHDVAPCLLRRLRSCPPEVLPFPLPHGNTTYSVVTDALSARLNRDLDAQRALFIAHVNEAEQGAMWAEQLAASTVAAVSCAPDQRDKVVSCAGELGAAAARFRAAREAALAGLCAAASAAAAAWAAALVRPPPPHDDFEDDPEADLLPAALEVFSSAAAEKLPQSVADQLLHTVVVDIVTRAEAHMLTHYYDRRGGLVVEARCRRLAAWVGAAGGAARARCRRLGAAAALLALERPAHAALPPAAAAALPPDRARALLARRTDFKMEDIKRLKL